MAKYNRPPLFTSPYSNISPPATSFDMARSSSRDSANFPCAFSSFSIPLSRTSSSSSTSHSSHAPAPTSHPTSAPMRRSSSASSSQTTWLASPYRSCLGPSSAASEPNSYLSDDDLLNLNIPVETIPTPAKRVAEMTIEEQIAHLRELQAQEEREDRARRETLSPRRKQVRFQPGTNQEKARRPSQLKRRSNTVRRGLNGLNGPM
ncbi:uncharacterized protein HMPREF1541_03918 [Cyphellophora europaea CBS 101466]|uniref:Uncharacterized protein n=1 Tax=Cyphellophora europaea (strain CBS 101466) TaxID=1220924 RepID=W2S204_CYPE1|nr:uncharacterized protein HMPREF1541_03918 [Cyphellophora europaea CBS 101466]ETN41979.1 hypothetical protein HMPREF1541_03918 [Cyphellophora europaea CBS 101466]